MMKSELMSQQAVKRRLDSIFGEYCDFEIKPADQQRFVQESKLLEKNFLQNNIYKNEVSNIMEEENDDKQDQSSSGTDLNTILEQISRVSPLLSPIVTHYSIKLRNNSLKKLFNKFYSHNEQHKAETEETQEVKTELMNGLPNGSMVENEAGSRSLKNRLDSLFGDFNEFEPVPDNQQQQEPQPIDNIPNKICKTEVSCDMEDSNYYKQDQSRTDLGTILEQISRVSPLLSPIITNYSIKLRNNTLKKLVNKFYPQTEQQLKEEPQQQQDEGNAEMMNGLNLPNGCTIKNELITKKAIKKRLDSIFGEYSDFEIKLSDQKQFEQESKLLEKNFLQNKIIKDEVQNVMEETNNDDKHEDQSRYGTDLDSILEQISRVSPLLSPIVNISTSSSTSGHHPIPT